MFAEEVSGLGVVVTVTSRFGPEHILKPWDVERIRDRLAYWLDEAAEKMAGNVRSQIRSTKGFYVNEDYDRRKIAKRTAIRRAMAGLDWVVTQQPDTGQSIKSMVKQYGMLAARMYIGVMMPLAGIVWTVVDMFSNKKKPIAVPWADIYSSALPYAMAMTNKEELERIEEETAKEVARIKEEERQVQETVQKAITSQSAMAASFRLPEGVISVSKGALVMNAGAPRIVEQKMEVPKPVVPALLPKPQEVKVIRVSDPIIYRPGESAVRH